MYKRQHYDHRIVIEKALKSVGFITRPINLFLENKAYPILEVWTQEGWIIVDSSNTWVGLARNYCPVSIQQLEASKFSMDWLYPIPERTFDLNHPCSYAYGW